MKYLIEKDIRKRKNFLAKENTLSCLKALKHNLVSSYPQIQFLRKENTTKAHTFGNTSAHNRCVISGRPRSIYREFRLSRIKFRALASSSHVPGIIKSSW